MELIEIMAKRRSIRKYTQEHIDDSALRRIIQAGVLAPVSRPVPTWKIILVRDKRLLGKMTGCRTGTGEILGRADCAVVMLGDPSASDVWVEDCSIAMANMHLMASSLGVGSCWIQGRRREAEDGRTTEAYLRDILGFPERYRLEAVLAMGMPGEKKAAHETGDGDLERIYLHDHEE